MLFDQMALELADQDIFVQRYFYEKDPRVCWQERYHDEIYLEDLHRKYPDDRLIILGDADSFFDPLTDQLASWAELLTKWKQLAILTPKNPLSWGMRELKLSEQMIFLPSTLEAISSIVSIFNQDQRPGLKYWIDNNKFPRAPELEEEEFDIDALKAYFYTAYHGQRAVKRDKTGRLHFSWFCACAVFPEISWDLTLAVGEALGEAHKQNLTNPRFIFQLALLEWFRKGTLPESAREQMVAELEKEDMKLVRKTIIRIVKGESSSSRFVC